ncbi:hypothetical protein [Piscinibacter terrae]|uniref:Uncharacterized protein n=1 Tax=Piscinibacter terrae TaxID=2496871 RepID=A0A3N7HSM5_9BURK|nr:hypothetical protein [Albitalea terrae]RQP25298.1 hypothetical protein DZC73_10740 [Albitalea terrae]
MLEILEILVGAVEAIRAWRFSVCVIGGFIVGLFAIDVMPPGGSPGVVFVCLLLFGTAIGLTWQSAHRRRTTPSGAGIDR